MRNKSTLKPHGRRHAGAARFTLVELLVVVAVIGILVGLMLPALSSSRMKAQTIKCLDNLAQINKLTLAYTVTWNGAYPPAVNTRVKSDPDGWMNLIADGQEANKSVFVCPVERRGAVTSYSLNCRELYIKKYLLTGLYPSWRDSDFAKSATGPAKILLVYEENYTQYSLAEYDKDNYSQDDMSFCADSRHSEPSHKNQIPILYADGHSNAPTKFDTTVMTYFTDIMSAWYEL